jgi:hypothetical protein
MQKYYYIAPKVLIRSRVRRNFNIGPDCCLIFSPAECPSVFQPNYPFAGDCPPMTVYC